MSMIMRLFAVINKDYPPLDVGTIPINLSFIWKWQSICELNI